MSNTKLGRQLWLMYTRSQFNSMCKSRDACTELYATVAGVGEVMRAKMAPAGSETRDMERLAKEPGLRSTRRRRVRSGWTQAGMVELATCGRMVGGVVVVFVEDQRPADLPFEVGGGVVDTADGGDMVPVNAEKVRTASLCVCSQFSGE
jgi:hypothetical protein